MYGNPCAIIACPIDENQLLAFIHLNEKQNNDKQLRVNKVSNCTK